MHSDLNVQIHVAIAYPINKRATRRPFRRAGVFGANASVEL